MARSRLSPDKLLNVTLSAILARGQGATDVQAVIDELTTTAAGRDDILAEVIGVHAGAARVGLEAEHTRAYNDAILDAFSDLPRLDEWIDVGVQRGSYRGHGLNRTPDR